MIPQKEGIRKYHTAHYKSLEPVIENFFRREFPGTFGPIVRTNIAQAIAQIFDENCPPLSCIKHGQLVWNAMDKSTRPDSPNRKYKPVILDLVTDEDVSLFEKEEPATKVKKNVIARIIKQAYEQGGVISSRDISLIMSMAANRISALRIEWETEHGTVLPHNGVINDVGPTITHKGIIVYKFIVEKKSPHIIARETNHSQKAVDRYLKDYARVKMLIEDAKDIQYIHTATNIAKPVIEQYIQIINQYVKEHL